MVCSGHSLHLRCCLGYVFYLLLCDDNWQSLQSYNQYPVISLKDIQLCVRVIQTFHVAVMSAQCPYEFHYWIASWGRCWGDSAGFSTWNNTFFIKLVLIHFGWLMPESLSPRSSVLTAQVRGRWAIKLACCCIWQHVLLAWWCLWHGGMWNGYRAAEQQSGQSPRNFMFSLSSTQQTQKSFSRGACVCWWPATSKLPIKPPRVDENSAFNFSLLL